MLVLSRKIGKKIIIDNDIEIEVIGIDGRSVRLGITAPKSVPVNRKEIHDKIAGERKMLTDIEFKGWYEY